MRVMLPKADKNGQIYFTVGTYVAAFPVHYPTRDLLRWLGMFKQKVFPDTYLNILFISPFLPSH